MEGAGSPRVFEEFASPTIVLNPEDLRERGLTPGDVVVMGRHPHDPTYMQLAVVAESEDLVRGQIGADRVTSAVVGGDSDADKVFFWSVRSDHIERLQGELDELTQLHQEGKLVNQDMIERFQRLPELITEAERVEERYGRAAREEIARIYELVACC